MNIPTEYVKRFEGLMKDLMEKYTEGRGEYDLDFMTMRTEKVVPVVKQWIESAPTTNEKREITGAYLKIWGSADPDECLGSLGPEYLDWSEWAKKQLDFESDYAAPRSIYAKKHGYLSSAFS